MNNLSRLTPESTYAASTALHNDGLAGLLKKGLAGAFIKSVVSARLPSLNSDFLSANLLNDIQKKSAQANQWDVLRLYIKMTNAVYKEDRSYLSLRREISDKLVEAAESIKPSDDPALDLKIATSLFDKHAKCDKSKEAITFALRTIAQSIVDNPSADKNLLDAANAILESTTPPPQETVDNRPAPAVVVKRKSRLLHSPNPELMR